MTGDPVPRFPLSWNALRRFRLVNILASAAVVLGSAVGIGGTALAATPIPSGPASPVFVGARAHSRPVRGVPATPRNRFMAPNGRSEIHNDAWQTDAYRWSGPLGRSPHPFSASLSGDCGSTTFDSHGRIITICVGLGGPQLFMLDRRTLDTLATFSLPPRQAPAPGANIFQDFTGGGYFYLDRFNRVVTSTTTHHIWVIGEAGAHGFRLLRDYSLAGVLSSRENLTSALPDSNGLLWFVTKIDGVVGTLNFKTGRVRTVRLGNGSAGEIENSFATGQSDGVYIATNRKLYRFAAGAGGRPRITWQVRYPNSFIHKPGQVDDGTGTTPTVMAGGYVNITDNADPMDVVVYRTAIRLRRHQSRMICRVPVFSRGASATENSLIVAGRSIIVENNYGYVDPTSVEGGKLTSPGIARIDINPNGRGCRRVWINRGVRIPTVVSKLSLANGLVYTYTKGPGTNDPWYWTAISFKTGRTVWKRLSGTGLSYNNNYAGIAVAPWHTAYLGVIGGMVALRDGS
jgi:hypothetical protein